MSVDLWSTGVTGGHGGELGVLGDLKGPNTSRGMMRLVFLANHKLELLAGRLECVRQAMAVACFTVAG